MSYLAMRNGPSTSAPSDGSRTLVIHDSQPREEDPNVPGGSSSGGAPAGSLRLRAAPRNRNRPRVTWTEDVVDNEHMGKKKTKICCIYHKPKRFDESSSEESSSESDSDSSCDRGHHHHRRSQRPEPNGDGGAGDGGTVSRDGQGGTAVHEVQEDETNAYERMSKKGKGKTESSK